jgi:phosphotransferase system enzyme I (PtsI)
MVSLKGKSVCKGIAKGPLLLFVPKGGEQKSSAGALSPAEELERLSAACEKAKTQLSVLYDKAMETAGEDGAFLFEVHQMMIDDEDFQDAMKESVEEGLSAEESAEAAGQQFAEVFEAMDDEYFKARSADMKDIASRIVRCLRGVEDDVPALTRPVIIAAEDLTPSQTIMLDKDKVLAFVTKKGSENSHTAILSRMLGIPALIGVDIYDENLEDGITVIADGNEGVFIADPDDETEELYAGKIEALEKEKASLSEMIGLPSETRDGRKVKLFANIGSPDDLELVKKCDAEGIGLFRSEFLYLGRDDFPDEETQFRAYKEVLEGMNGKNVVIRTMDIGADKKVAYFGLPDEENPALGMRAIRICLTRPEILKTQLRALLRASAFGDLSIMYLMIASLSEVEELKEIFRQVKEELDSEGIAHGEPEQGIMIETPAAALISDELAKAVDFFSIGTNDLTQYTLAVDRQNEELDRFCDKHHRAVLKLMEMAAKNAHENGIWVGICGELGADESLTEEFIRMGIDELSVSPAALLKLRKKVRSI